MADAGPEDDRDGYRAWHFDETSDGCWDLPWRVADATMILVLNPDGTTTTIRDNRPER